MQTRHFARLVFSLGLSFLLAGCGGNRESKLIGSWKARPLSAVLGGIQGQANGMSTQEATRAAQTLAAATLDIRADKTFTLNLSAPIEGTWAWNGDTGTLSLTPTKAAGQAITAPPGTSPAQPAFKAKLSDDDSMLSLSNNTPTASGGMELNFDKS